MLEVRRHTYRLPVADLCFEAWRAAAAAERSRIEAERGVRLLAPAGLHDPAYLERTEEVDGAKHWAVTWAELPPVLAEALDAPPAPKADRPPPPLWCRAVIAVPLSYAPDERRDAVQAAQDRVSERMGVRVFELSEDAARRDGVAGLASPPRTTGTRIAETIVLAAHVEVD